MTDFFSILIGLGLYFVLFLPTSYSICWWAGPFDFWRRSSLFRLCIAQALSFAVMPYMLFLLYRVASPWLMLLPATAGLVQIAPTLRRVRWRHAKPVLILLLVITCIAPVLVAPWTIGTRTYLSVVRFDYAKHVAVTHALTADGVPPFNPSFAPQQPLPLFYYYFWFLSSSTVEVFGKGLVPARNAVVAGVIFTAMSLVAAVIVSAWLLFPGPRRRLRSRVYLALGLLLVSGLDLIPFLINVVKTLTSGHTSIPESLDWWNEIVASWTATMLWVPHHTAAFIVMWLIYWESALAPEAPLRQSWRIVLFRALALASVFGMSVWLGLLAAAIFAAWTIQQMIYRNWSRVRACAVAGLIAAVLLSPFIVDLARAKKTSSAVVALRVRQFRPIVVRFERIDHELNLSRLPAYAIELIHQGISLVFLPLNYGMELGVYFLAAFLYWRFCRGTPYALRGGRAWWPLLVTCALVVTFVRSAVAYNDLGWRGFLPLQLALLLALVMVWNRLADGGLSAGWRPVLVILASIGLATTVCDLFLMRLYPIVADFYGPNTGQASSAFSRREAYRRLDILDPSHRSYVQHNPDRDVDYESALFGDRRVPVEDTLYGSLYSVDPNTFQYTFKRIAAVFKNCEAGSEGYGEGVAADYQIRFWLFQSSDPVWQNRQCWIWSRPAVFVDQRVIVVAAQKR